MAIVEMMKIELVAVSSDRKKLLRALQKLGCVQIEPVNGEEMKRWKLDDEGELERAEQTLGRLSWAINRLSRLDTAKKSLLAPRPEVGGEEVTAALAAMGQALETIDALEGIDRMHSDARAEESRAQTRLSQLEPYRALSEPLERIGQSRLTMSALGTMSARGVDAARAAIEEEKLAGRFDVVSVDKDGAHIFAVSPLDEWNRMSRILKDADFNQESFADYTGTPAHNIDILRARIQELRASHAELDAQARQMCDQLPRLKVLYDVLAMERDRDRAATLLAGTRSAFMMTGWVPKKVTEELDARLHEVSPSCVVAFTEPADDEEPPTLMENNRFLKPYQSIIAMYSLPNYRGIDPTMIMTPFFICFFGMMVSDAGYGVVMGIVAALAVKFMKLRGTVGDIAKILVAGGASTLVWGVLYGGWFGVSVPALMFAPMDEPLSMMILCVALGLIQIIVSLIMAMYMNIKRGKPWDAVFDQASWIAVLVGLVMLVYPPLAEVGKWLAIAGVAVIVAFGGRGKKNIIMRIGGGLGKLYGVSGYLSDLLSYARLFGMGLATGVIGMVINLVSGMLWENPLTMIFAVIVFVGGHVFNLAINALGAYVHSCRLQYIEFFSRFYEDGGREFKPLRAKTKYVDMVENDAA
ncbi:MAG: V-type ATP synthase subunit I [Candidatus Fimadaptatus sp.]|jgi:V/A-type H+-transporting ATPase subunit I